MSKKNHSYKICDECGEGPYYRCHEVKLWMRQNPGHRTGWTKASKHICMKCMPQARVSRMLARVRAYFGPNSRLLPSPKKIV